MAPRALGALFAMLAAIAFVVSIASSAWWAGHPTVDGRRVDATDVTVGLVDATRCTTDGGCEAVPIESTGELIRLVELGAIGLAVLLALALALSAWSVGDRRKGLATANLVTTLLAAAGGGAVIALGPLLDVKQSVTVPIGWGAFVFAGAVASSLLASTLARKIEPEPLRLKTGGPQPVALSEVVVSPIPALAGGTMQGLPPPARASTPDIAVPPPGPPPGAPPGPPVDPFARTDLPTVGRTKLPTAPPRPKPPSAPPPLQKRVTQASVAPPARAIAPPPAKRTSEPELRPSAPTLPHAVPPMPSADNMPPPSKLSAKELATTVEVDASAKAEAHFESTARGTLDPRIVGRGQRSASEARTGQHDATAGDVTSTGVSIAQRIVSGQERALSTVQRQVARAPTEDPFESGRAAELVPADGPLTDELAAVSGIEAGLDMPSDVTEGPVTDVLSVVAAAEVLDDLAAQASGTIGDVTDATRTSDLIPARETERTPIPTVHERAQISMSTASSTLPPPKTPMRESVQSGPTPACPQCESPMAWVEEHLRFYCKQCRMYF